MGIDISKDFLDIFDAEDDSFCRVPNVAAAVAELAQRCALQETFVLFEATGHYDAGLRHALSEAGVAFARVNPARARDFARAAGYLAKTDAVDARMLAAMARCLEPQMRQAPSREREQLALWHKRRDQLVAMRAQERTRRSDCADPAIAADLDQHLAWLDDAVRQLYLFGVFEGSLIPDEGVEYDEEFTGDGDEGELCGFAGLAQSPIDFAEHRG
jgi:transposase